MKKNKTMKTLSFNIIPYYSRLRKNKMYVVSVIEETNANATDSNGLVYSVKSLFEQRDIRYKKEAKDIPIRRDSVMKTPSNGTENGAI